MKKIFTFLTLFLFAFSFVFTLAGCGETPADEPEQKEYSLSISDAQKNGVTLKVDEEVKIDVTATEGATLNWKVNDSNVATVTNGTVKGISAGSCVVTVTIAEDTTKVKTIVITVEEKADEPEPEPEPTKYEISIKGDKTVEVGKEITLTATLNPALLGATFEWTTDNANVSVKNGVVKGLKEGTSKVTVSYTPEKGDKATATIEITVTAPVLTSIELSGDDKVAIGKTIDLTYTLAPAGTNATVSFKSDNETVATVDETGKVTAIATGTATITATATQGEVSVTDTITITVTATTPQSCTINGDETIKAGAEATYTATLLPEDCDKTVVWGVNNGLATIDANGKLVAKYAGTVVVSCTDAGGVTHYKTVTITAEATSAVIYGANTLEVGDKEAYKALVVSTQAKQLIYWASSDPSILTVDNEGNVTAIKEGTATLIASADETDTIKAELEITVSAAVTYDKTVVIDPSATGLTAGTKVKIEEKEYTFGTDYFASLADANLQEGTNVILMEGTYDAYTFNVGHLYITECVDNKAEITGIWTLADGVGHITFDGLHATGSGQIYGVNSNDRITIENCIFDASYVTDASQGTIYFAKTASNVKVIDCEFINTKSYRSVRFEGKMTNFTVTGCTFSGTGNFDWIRSANSCPEGIVNISNNVFDTSSQSGIMFNHMGQVYLEICGNTFTSMTNTCVDLRVTDGVKCTSYYNISYNIFDNSAYESSDAYWGCIRLRFNDFTADTLKVDINYNEFINWNDASMVNVLDNATTNTDIFELCNFENNYISYEEVTADTFDKCSVVYSVISKEAVEKAISIYNLDSTDDTVKLVGEQGSYTKEVYPTLVAALREAQEGDIIYLLPGTYTDSVKISINNLTIRSLEYDIDNAADLLTSDKAAVYTGTITLAKKLKGLTINGLVFSGNAQILNELGDVGTAQNTDTNLDEFNFVHNAVSSNLASGKGFIYFVEAASSYSHDINISDNAFYGSENFKADAMIWLDNCYDIMVANNTFKDIKGKAFYVNDTTKGMSGQKDSIVSNTFNNVGSGIYINWVSCLPLSSETAEVYVMNNKFNGVTDYAIFFGCMNNTDIYNCFKVEYNQFANVATAIHFDRVSKTANIDCWYNVFYGVPSKYYYETISVTKSTAYLVSLDARYNTYLNDDVIITPDTAKFSIEEGTDNPIDISGAVEDLEYGYEFEEYATSIIILDDDELFAGEAKEIEVLYDPSGDVFYKDIIWVVEDETILTIDGFTCTPLRSGTTQVTAIYAKDTSLTCTATFTVKEYNVLELRYEGNGILNVDDTVTVTATVENAGDGAKLEWSTSDANIATVDENGKVTAKGIGVVTITCKINGAAKTATVGFSVVGETMEDKLLQLLVEANNGVIMYEKINYIGYEVGYESVPHYVYGSANKYYAATNPTVVKNMMSSSNKNINWDRTHEKVELITVHDTGSASPSANAQANSKWCTNLSNTGTSWHYTIGNDGIYQQLDDKYVAWHAGDGSDTPTGTIDTGVVATEPGKRATVTIENGYYVVNGTLTTCEAPKGPNGETLTTADIVDSGIVTIIGENNHYYIGTYYNSTYKKIASYGGYSSIGIETAVNKGSDVYLTWQYTAKFVASKLVEYDLTLDRVVYHNNLSGKNCPQTMRTAGKCEMFESMVAIEYEIAKNYANYTIEFESSNPDVLDNSGRVVGNGPRETTQVNYTIKVTNNDTKATASQVCSVLVIGTRNAQ